MQQQMQHHTDMYLEHRTYMYLQHQRHVYLVDNARQHSADTRANGTTYYAYTYSCIRADIMKIYTHIYVRKTLPVRASEEVYLEMHIYIHTRYLYVYIYAGGEVY